MDTKEKNIKDYAIVIGDWHFNTLGMVRSLGEQGVMSVYINMSDWGYAEKSKYTLKTYHAHTQEDVLNAILDAVKTFGGRPAIFPGSDISALYVDNCYNQLKDICFCPGFEGKAEYYMDKYNMSMLAKEAGFNIPESAVIEINEPGFAEMRKFGLPCIIKPLKSVDGKKADIIVCKTNEDLENAITWLQSEESGYIKVLIQEFVNGTKNAMTGYCGVKAKGKKAYVYGELKKIREYPLDRGSTSFAKLQEKITYIDPDIIDRFLEKTGYEGIFDIDIKLVDGVPYFLEINFRNGALSYAMTAAGFNLPYIWYCLKADKPFDPVDFKEVYLMCERDDLNHVKDKNISPLEWVKCIKKTDAMMVFNKQDKAPFQLAYGKAVTAALSLLARKAR